MGGGIDQSIGPGLGGFIAFFLLACALWLLMRNMGKHLRNVAYLAEREEAAQQPDKQGRADAPASREDAAGEQVQTRPRSLSSGYPRDQEGTDR
ncbi:hypothetical protein BJY21_003415 [Kineosphaera limosa]|uniref:Uncharacterized protein n=1 Tax=Kineosphaera limosa NBRC 100340 TaxID=1184609 RepID=K6WJW6_9MICO|nr:hypothetical protein [Kineosphaera limosa]NYE02231.1 hypothetical protein [Kineosphaera limosa]GAB94086.1 hypothetical protein KILIM_003_00080 [Kineosphaera limosa NBRC 100340]